MSKRSFEVDEILSDMVNIGLSDGSSCEGADSDIGSTYFKLMLNSSNDSEWPVFFNYFWKYYLYAIFIDLLNIITVNDL